jgi:penicillin-binding protein 1A
MKYGRKETEKKQKSLKSTPKKLGTKLGITFIKGVVLSLLVITVVLACAGIGVLKGIIDDAPDISQVDVSPNGFKSVCLDTDGNVIEELVMTGSNRVYKSIDEIPDYLQKAFIAIEDERFYEHNGIDIRGIIRAGVVGITSGHFSEGASTITQQLLKNSVFSGGNESSLPEKFKRKIQEQYLALQLEKNMSKELILENYLNTINLGSNTLGVQAASKRYFNKDVSELTVSESAVIAAITQNPSAYNPITNPTKNAERREKVLNNMLKHEFITQEQYDEAIADDVYSRIQNVNEETTTSFYSYFTDELTQQIIEDLIEQKGYTRTAAYNTLYGGGLTIQTTQDSSLQAICDEVINNPDNYPAGTEVSLTYRLSIQHEDKSEENLSEKTLETYFKEKVGAANFDLLFDSEEEAQAYVNEYKEAVLQEGDTILGETFQTTPQPQISFVLMDQYTGEVKAIVGGRGDKTASLTLNRATDTTRQPGSTFKVVSTYGPALDTAGYTLGSVIYDASYSYANGKPISGPTNNGMVTVREALYRSLNIVAVKTLTDITPQLGFDYLQNLGFSTLVEKPDENGNSDIGQSLALGGITNGVTNLELTASFAAIANQGVYTEPILYTKVLDHDGKILLENTPVTRSVFKDTTAYLLTDAMRDVLTQGTGRAAALTVNMDVAGKTGTTNSYKDFWFVGYTPYYTAGIWAGYDTNSKALPSNNRFEKEIWSKIMSSIHENLEYKTFTQPDSIETASICKKSGKLAVPGVCDMDPRGSQITTEIFAKGTVPEESCDAHISVSVCSLSGLPATEYCPLDQVTSHVYMILPDDCTEVTDDTQYLLPIELNESYCPYHYFGGSYENGLPDTSASATLPQDSTADSNTADTSDSSDSSGHSDTASDQ